MSTLRWFGLLAAGMQMFACGHAIGQARPADDDGYRISVGPAFERDLRSKSASSGAALSIEKTLIDEWLEVESRRYAVECGGTKRNGDRFPIQETVHALSIGRTHGRLR